MWALITVIGIITFSVFKYRSSQQNKESNDKESNDKESNDKESNDEESNDEESNDEESKIILSDNRVFEKRDNSVLDTFDGNIEELEFYDSIVSILSKAGFYTKTEKNSIYFEYENERYAIHIVDAHSLCIDCKIFYFKEDEVFFFQNYVNQLNWNYLFTRFLIDDKEMNIIARAWYPVNDSTNVSYCFGNIVHSLISSAKDFRKGLDNNKL